jgi:hypothetical protein
MFVIAPSDGEHLVCFSVRQYIPNSYCSLSPKLQLGEPGDSRIISPVENQLEVISRSVSNNNILVSEIVEEQKLQRMRERLFRELSNTLHSNVYWLAALQIVVLALTALWQMRYMKKFFQSRKLV